MVFFKLILLLGLSTSTSGDQKVFFSTRRYSRLFRLSSRANAFLTFGQKTAFFNAVFAYFLYSVVTLVPFNNKHSNFKKKIKK